MSTHPEFPMTVDIPTAVLVVVTGARVALAPSHGQCRVVKERCASSRIYGGVASA
jgi:hypothetical protein